MYWENKISKRKRSIPTILTFVFFVAVAQKLLMPGLIIKAEAIIIIALGLL